VRRGHAHRACDPADILLYGREVGVFEEPDLAFHGPRQNHRFVPREENATEDWLIPHDRAQEFRAGLVPQQGRIFAVFPY
jgi:hypothetical protein